MPKVEFHTSVDEIIECEDINGFQVKKVNIGRADYWTPFRAIHLSTTIPPMIRTKIVDRGHIYTIFEANRVVYMDKTYNSIERALGESDEIKIKNFLRVNDWLSRRNFSIPVSFSTFPHLKIKRFDELLNYIYAYSSIVLTPHIRYGKGAETKEKYTPKKFCKYVDDALVILSDRNAKPLFVPFDINYDANTRDKILKHYAKNGYMNIWIDFQGNVFSARVIAKIRNLNIKIKEFFGKEADNVILYFTNIKKIPREAGSDFRISPSDFLGAFSYGNIIGSPWKGLLRYQPEEEEQPYWKKKGYRSEEEYNIMIFKRDTSIFEKNTYYYLHPERFQVEDPVLDGIRKSILQIGLSKKSIAEEVSSSINGFITSNELNHLREIVMDQGEILDYINEKTFFQSEGTYILKEIMKSKNKKEKIPKVEKGLFDFVD